jgi:hypothetical protein
MEEPKTEVVEENRVGHEYENAFTDLYKWTTFTP